MKRKIIAMLIGLTAALQLTASADTYDSITVNGSPAVGDSFTVTISVTSDSGDDIGYLQASLEYDDTVIEFVSGDAVGGGGMISVHTFPDAQPDSIQCELTFKAVGSGDTVVSLSNGYVFSAEGIVLSEPSSSVVVHVEGETVTEAPPEDSSEVEEEEDSSEAETVTEAPEESLPETETEEEAPPEPVIMGYLTSLVCDAGELSPEFAYNVFDYTVHVANSTETAELTAEAAAFSDVITYSDGGALEVGDNIRTVTVTAEDGTVNVYTVNIIRAPGSSSADTSSKPQRDKYKDMLNPALAIVLITLVIALFIVIMWIKGNLSGKNKNNKKKKRK